MCHKPGTQTGKPDLGHVKNIQNTLYNTYRFCQYGLSTVLLYFTPKVCNHETMDNILKKQLRQYVNHYELFGDRSSLIMASMLMTILLNKDIDDELVNID